MPTSPVSTFHGLIGAAQADITPPFGIYARNWGAAESDVATGIHRPLTAAVVTLQENTESKPLVLTSLDLGWWRTAHDEWLLRGALLKELDLDESRLVIALTHTHAGPAVCREDSDKPGGEYIEPYLESLREILFSTIRTALSQAKPARLEWSYGRCTLAANRDLPDPEKPRFVCGFNPENEADDTLLVGRAISDDGRTVATIVNYACHPTTLAWQNSLISPDYIGAMRETVQNSIEAPCLFLQGASGELAPREQYTGDVEVAERHGRQMGHAVLSALSSLPAAGTELKFQGIVESGAPLAVWAAAPREAGRASGELKAELLKIEMPLKKMASTAETELELKKCTDRVMRERIRRRLRIRRSLGDGGNSAESVWTWRIGEAILIAQRNEAYSLLQTSLRAAFPHCTIVVLNVANGHIGYLPPAELYSEDLYPVWQTPYERGGLELLIGSSEAAIKSLLSSG